MSWQRPRANSRQQRTMRRGLPPTPLLSGCARCKLSRFAAVHPGSRLNAGAGRSPAPAKPTLEENRYATALAVASSPPSARQASAAQAGIGLFELAHRPRDVVGLFKQCFGIPFAARLVEKIAAVDVDRSRQARDWIGYRVDDVVAERFRVAFAQGLGACRLQLAARASRPSPEDIVLAAAVDADHCPHAMIVRHDGHLRCPDHVEDGELGRMKQFLHFGALGLT